MCRVLISRKVSRFLLRVGRGRTPTTVRPTSTTVAKGNSTVESDPVKLVFRLITPIGLVIRSVTLLKPAISTIKLPIACISTLRNRCVVRATILTGLAG